MVLGVHGEVVDRGRIGQILRHRPRHQHAVALEAEVVVQPTGMMFLDDELVVVTHRGLRLAAPVQVSSTRRACFGRSSACPIRRRRRRAARAGRRRLATRSSTSSKRRCRSFGSSISSHVRGAATVGCSRPRIEYGAIVVFDRVVLAPVQEDLACAQALGHRRGDQLWHRLFQLLRNTLGEHHRTARADRLRERHVQVQALAAAGERIRRQPDVVHQVADGGATSHSWRHRDVVAGVEVEHERVAGPGFPSTNRHCGTCTSSAACWPIQAMPSTVSMIG